MANTENKCEITMNGKTYPCHISMAMDLVGGKGFVAQTYL